jgi:hypothetical protein
MPAHKQGQNAVPRPAMLAAFAVLWQRPELGRVSLVRFDGTSTRMAGSGSRSGHDIAAFEQ